MYLYFAFEKEKVSWWICLGFFCLEVCEQTEVLKELALFFWSFCTPWKNKYSFKL